MSEENGFKHPLVKHPLVKQMAQENLAALSQQLNMKDAEAIGEAMFISREFETIPSPSSNLSTFITDSSTSITPKRYIEGLTKDVVYHTPVDDASKEILLKALRLDLGDDVESYPPAGKLLYEKFSNAKEFGDLVEPIANLRDAFQDDLPIVIVFEECLMDIAEMNNIKNQYALILENEMQRESGIYFK